MTPGARIKGWQMLQEVREEVQQQPVYQALAAIRKGTAPDGSALIEGVASEPLLLSASNDCRPLCWPGRSGTTCLSRGRSFVLGRFCQAGVLRGGCGL